MEKNITENTTENLKMSLKFEEKNNKSNAMKYECIEYEIEDLTKKNMDQFELSQKYDNLNQKLNQLELENHDLKQSLNLEKDKCLDLEKCLKKTTKELEEFKKINLVQENCIENSESEIDRLNECLRISKENHTVVTKNVQLSQAINLQEIVDDLNRKLRNANLELENYRISSIASDSKPYNIEEQNAIQIKRTKVANRFKVYTDFELKIIDCELNNEIKETIIQILRKMVESVENVELIPEKISIKLNQMYGKHWSCFLAKNFIKTFANYKNGTYLKCEINNNSLILFQTNSQLVNQQSLESVSQPTNDQTIRILKKSLNIETQTEKFIVNLTRDAINRNFDDYNSMSSYIRDTICAKYSSQWFVSVGQSNSYCTSWALSRNRKFLLFEIDNIKLTIGEVGGWLW